MLTGLPSLDGMGPTNDGPEGEGGQPSFVGNHLIVQFAPGTTTQKRDQVIQQEGASLLHKFYGLDYVLVQLSPSDANMIPRTGIDGIVNRWVSRPEVVYASPNRFLRSSTVIPDDPGFVYQWAMNNVGQTGGFPDSDIDAPQAWDIFTGTRDVVVAIIDTGIDYNHPDLVNNMWRNPGEIPGNGIDDDGNGFVDDVYGYAPAVSVTSTDPMDFNGHGTHVAGTVGAEGNNDRGVAGVAWNVRLMAINAMEGDLAGTEAAIAAGISYATMMREQRGVNIVASNNSYGGDFESQLELAAITRHIQAGIVFVAAAGNDNRNTDLLPAFPANYDLDGIISVGASNHLDFRSSFSNFGAATVDLFAPGGDGDPGDLEAIVSTWPPAVPDSAGLIGSQYDWIQGTSMASPHVAGAVALVRGLAPEMSVLQTKQLLMDTVDQMPWLTGLARTGGRLNLATALGRIFATPIEGTVWRDDNGNAVRDAGEVGLAGWTVYLDRNNNGVLNAGEASTTTGADGRYTLAAFEPPGTYIVRQQVPANWTVTYPTGGAHTVRIVNRGERITGKDFGNKAQPGSVSGRKFHDLNGNGIRDLNEPGLAGVWIYADLDRNGTIALGEPAAITDANGAYIIHGIPAGEIIIREVLDPGWETTYPILGHHVVMVEPAVTIQNINFGNAVAYDWGDAPSPYPTLAAHSGPSHGLLPGFHLGLLVDSEPDGQPHPDALGDDLRGLPDDDGVVFPGPLFAGSTVSIEVTISNGAYPPGYLQGWVDFNRDGDWNDPGEQIIKDMLLREGVHQISFTVPANVVVGRSFARFRYGYEKGLGVTGHSRAGSVEDHAVLLLKDEPVANPDSFEVEQDVINAPLNVLANDFPSSTGVLAIINVTQPVVAGTSPPVAGHGTVTIAPGGQQVLYTPGRGRFSPPNEAFTYTISDGTGKISTTSVTVFVRPEFTMPIAVDDAFYVTPGSTNNLPVLLNDLPGVLGTMQLLSVTTPSAGTATIHDNGTPADPLDDYIVYIPDGRFSELDQFQYTIGNANGIDPERGTATVTVFREPRLTDPKMEFLFEIEDTSGNPISEVRVGSEFVLVVSVQDLRPGAVAPGIFAAYLDVLFDRTLAMPKFDAANELGFAITFSPEYSEGILGDSTIPGLLDEVGAFQSGFNPLGAGLVEMFRVVFTANAVGDVTFIGDPADDLPDNNVLFFNPPSAAAPPDIRYGLAALSIVAPGTSSGGGGGHQLTTLDVNADGRVTPFDVLLVVNYLNTRVLNLFAGSNTFTQLDVNRDNKVTPLDALLVINHLNSRRSGEGEGEGEWSPMSAGDPGNDAGGLIADDALVLAVLPVNPVVPAPAPKSNARAISAFFASSESRTVGDWRTQIGQVDLPVPARVAADRGTDRSWESLLDILAEDLVETLDG